VFLEGGRHVRRPDTRIIARYRRALADDVDPGGRGAGLRSEAPAGVISSAALVGQERSDRLSSSPASPSSFTSVAADGLRRLASNWVARRRGRSSHALGRSPGIGWTGSTAAGTCASGGCATARGRRFHLRLGLLGAGDPTTSAGSMTRPTSSSLSGEMTSAAWCFEGWGTSGTTQRRERAYVPGLARTHGARPRPAVQALHRG
jgi:hypothetical protein